MKPKTRTELIASFQTMTLERKLGHAAAYADVSAKEREESKTMADGSYPIKSCEGDGPTVESAVHAVGRGGADHDKIRKHIIEAAADLKCSNLIPDSWNSDGSLKEGETAAAPPPPPDDTEKAPPAEDDAKPKGSPDLQADTDVSKAIDAAIAAQEKDPDSGDPNDEKVLKLLKEAKAAQADDIHDTAKGEDAPAKPKAEPETEGKSPDAKPAPPKPLVKLAAGDVPAEPESAHEAESEQNPPPEVDCPELVGPEFAGVLVIEGQPTGDGRKIAPDALTWRTFPLPLMLLKTATHDPMGFDQNDPAVIAGRIETITREPGEGDTQLVRFGGHFLANEDGQEAAELAEQMGRLGVSADIAVQERQVEITEVDEIGLPLDGEETLTEGTIMGGTACPFPAFEGCYLVLGDGSDLPDAKQIPQAAEAPEQVTAGGQLIHWMTYEECDACDQGVEVVVASGAGPVRPPAEWFADPGFEPDDGRLVEIYGRNGRREGKYACPITVTADGRVYGHLAPWGVCHTGRPGCVTAPPSAAGYAHFMRGQHITTAEGELVRVGVITADAPHAALGLAAAAAMSHYDDTATVVADVACGDDAYGIWVAGAVRPDASDEQIRKLTASSLSGDWRLIGGQLELVAALCVPVPGFPLAMVAGGQQQAVVAYGQTVMDRLKHPPETKSARERAIDRLLRRDARERVAAL